MVLCVSRLNLRTRLEETWSSSSILAPKVPWERRSTVLFYGRWPTGVAGIIREMARVKHATPSYFTFGSAKRSLDSSFVVYNSDLDGDSCEIRPVEALRVFPNLQDVPTAQATVEPWCPMRHLKLRTWARGNCRDNCPQHASGHHGLLPCSTPHWVQNLLSPTLQPSSTCSSHVSLGGVMSPLQTMCRTRVRVQVPGCQRGPVA
jgi:hypothetical protein